MTEAHVAADAECASRLAELGERFRAWSTLSRLMVERDELQAGAIATAAYQIAVLEGRRCFDAFLAVEYAILADRRAKVRELDSARYGRAPAPDGGDRVVASEEVRSVS